MNDEKKFYKEKFEEIYYKERVKYLSDKARKEALRKAHSDGFFSEALKFINKFFERFKKKDGLR